MLSNSLMRDVSSRWFWLSERVVRLVELRQWIILSMFSSNYPSAVDTADNRYCEIIKGFL